MKQRLLIFTLCLMCGAFFTHAQAQTFKSFVNKKEVSTGERFRVSFKLDNAQGRPKLPAISNFQVVSGPNQSSSMQFINGNMSQSITYSYDLVASKTGTFTIGSASVKVGDKTLTTDPIKIKVVKGKAAPAQANNGRNAQGGKAKASVSQDLMKKIRDNLYIRPLASKRTVYQGEQFTLTYKLFSRVTLGSVEPPELPSFNGFWTQDIDLKQTQMRQEVIDGVAYQTAILKQTILFPQKSGKLTIDPMTMKAQVRVATRPDPRDPFGGFFNRYQEVPVELTSGKFTITVKPLPESGKPEDFAGAVGDYALDVSADKNKTNTGDPVTVSVKLSGTGNLEIAELPQLTFPPDFDIFDPELKERISQGGGKVSGYKQADYLLIPRNPGTYKLPATSFSFFNPKTKRYKTLNQPAIEIVAEGEAQQERVTGTNLRKEEVELLNKDIRFIKTETSLTEKGYSFLGTAPFWGLLGSPIAAFAFLLVWKRRQDQEAQDVVGTKQKRATKVAKKRLTTAKQHLDSGDRQTFFKEINDTTWRYLSDKLAIGQSALSRDNVREKLAEKSVNETLIQRLLGLIETAEMALFAPATEGDMQQAYQEAVSLISDLEEAIK
ncbi:MAG: BatD family protein [Bacteroidota bacterium]